MRKKLVLLAASLAMVLTSTAALAQTESGGSVSEDELLCFLPEGCDTNGDGAPELRAGEPVFVDEEMSTGVVQYENAG